MSHSVPGKHVTWDLQFVPTRVLRRTAVIPAWEILTGLEREFLTTQIRSVAE